jgi:hypothetical protein
MAISRGSSFQQTPEAIDDNPKPVLQLSGEGLEKLDPGPTDFAARCAISVNDEAWRHALREPPTPSRMALQVRAVHAVSTERA